ncbi:MAG: hypothetical protein IPL96_07350 [Holophagaceae bacterium]|nr:hypothetical protein [Holophagaceae bacterium]
MRLLLLSWLKAREVRAWSLARSSSASLTPFREQFAAFVNDALHQFPGVARGATGGDLQRPGVRVVGQVAAHGIAEAAALPQLHEEP